MQNTFTGAGIHVKAIKTRRQVAKNQQGLGD